MDVVRITELQPKTYVEQGDYIAIDNQSDGTKKVQFTNLLDDTLSQENKIAPANIVGNEIATVKDEMEGEIATIRAAVGSPLKASTVAQMTDKNKIYVYVGSESGYTNGNWYYWNGSAWTSGGVYNSVAVVTDPTLTLSGVPADAKATGDEIGNLKSELTDITESGELVLHPPFVAGHKCNASGQFVTDSKRIANEVFLDISNCTGITYTVNDGYRVAFHFYSAPSESNFVSTRYWFTGNGRIRKEANYLRVTYTTVTEASAMTIAEASNITLSVDYPLFNNDIKDKEHYTFLLDALKDESVDAKLKFYQGNPNGYEKRRIHTQLIDVSEAESLTINIGSGMQWYIRYYDENDTYKVGRGWYTESKTIVPEYGYVRILLAYANNADIYVGDFVDTMLSVSYKPNTLAQYINTDIAIPSYWQSALDTAISTVLTKEETTDAQGDSFVFITDTHWDKNAKNSPALIRNILKQTNVKKVFFGGDVLTLYDSQAKALSWGRKFFNAFSGIPVFSSLGNHDVNNNHSTYGSEAYLTYPQVYSYMFKHIEDNIKEMPKWSDTNGDVNRNFYYYIDNTTQKIRYIVLNNARARIGTVQTNWLKSKLTEMPTGWTALVFAHEYWFGLTGTTPNEVTNGTDIETAINEVYDSLNGTVGALIVGHCHYDYDKTSAKGYPIIATTTDAYDLSDTAISPTMTLGTNTEQAFDVYTIDTKNRKIYATRIGAGTSRSFDY